jgi:hypothetical protein
MRAPLRAIMPSNLKAQWKELRDAEPGQRFQAFHDKQKERSPKWAGPLYIGGAIVSLAVGVVLAFIPGPAILFFAIAGALLASQSAFVARKLDTAEVRGRRAWKWLKSKWGRGNEDEPPPTRRTRPSLP